MTNVLSPPNSPRPSVNAPRRPAWGAAALVLGMTLGLAGCFESSMLAPHADIGIAPQLVAPKKTPLPT
ncbi:MAG: hypothetical protein ABI633_03875, partial [Burkholderiales bacterium]